MSEKIEIHLVDGPIASRIEAPPLVRELGLGAITWFEGVVRPEERGRGLTALHYEAYEPMTSRELRRLAEQTARRHGANWVGVWHSLGRVPSGEASFRLGVAGRRRAGTLAATEEFIDRMKQIIPLWKTPELSPAENAPKSS